MTLRFLLKEHDFVLRYLGPADAGKYLTFFNALGEESIRCRFGHLLASLTASAAEQRTNEDTGGEKAAAIFDQGQEQILAVGRCYLDHKTRDAEIALVVSEAVRRLGLGRLLLQQLIRIARDEGSRSISAFIATNNAPVVQLLRSAGFVVRPSDDGDDLKLTLNIPPPGLSAPHDAPEPVGHTTLARSD